MGVSRNHLRMASRRVRRRVFKVRASSREEGEWSGDGRAETPTSRPCGVRALWYAGASPQSPCAPFLMVSDVRWQLEISHSGKLTRPKSAKLRIRIPLLLESGLVYQHKPGSKRKGEQGPLGDLGLVKARR